MRNPGNGWLGKRLRIFPAFDREKKYAPMTEGVVIAFIDGPSVIVRDATGRTQAWPVTMPMDELPPRELSDRRVAQ